MKRKTLRLSEETLKIIKEVMKEEDFIKSEAAAVEFIIKEYEKRKTLAEDIVEEFNNKNKNWMDRVRLASREAERKGRVAIDCLNTILNKGNYKHCSHIENDKNPVVNQSEEKWNEIISKQKQKKDNKERKERNV